MEDSLIAWLRANPEYSLVIVPAVAFAEAIIGVGLFVSGIFLLSICTFLYVEQIATLEQMLPLAFLGAAVSDHVGYYIGRWIGPRFHHTRVAERHRDKLDHAESLFRRFGPMAIVIGRLMTAIRSLVPVLTGISGIDRLRYTAYDLLACTIWTAGLGVLVVGLNELF